MGLFGSIGNFVKSACSVAGRGMSAVASVPLKGIKTTAGLVGKVPIIGKPLSATSMLCAQVTRLINFTNLLIK